MNIRNKTFSELCIIKVCKLAGVNIYRLPGVKDFDGENGYPCTRNMFTLKQFSNKLCKMSHLLPTEMDKAYPEQLVKMLSTGVTAAFKKPEKVKRG